MFKKMSMGMMAVVMAVVFSAFTAPKSTEGTSAKAMDPFWYQVVNGVIPQNAPLYVQAAKSSVNSPCNAGTARDCLRGFNQQQNTSAGPITSPGNDQIKTNDQP